MMPLGIFWSLRTWKMEVLHILCNLLFSTIFLHASALQGAP